jgi:hypothetical protein
VPPGRNSDHREGFLFPFTVSPRSTKRLTGLRVCKLSPYQDARAIRADRFIVQFALIDRK